jgi:hypothetical protein
MEDNPCTRLLFLRLWRINSKNKEAASLPFV